ncbi:hypothetical protein AACV_gp1 [Anopheline-associated C virus]|uniref:hypothetical protein n=1 Tax=Anopheline-associated C virus TaxID=1398939 RepID=UPI0003AFFA51|nr:hypothetical protein AACV_gp1 [Anopheline-associated C virus]AGW51775.1 hypothetical protein [Anopheline-associated C virus]
MLCNPLNRLALDSYQSLLYPFQRRYHEYGAKEGHQPVAAQEVGGGSETQEGGRHSLSDGQHHSAGPGQPELPASCWHMCLLGHDTHAGSRIKPGQSDGRTSEVIRRLGEDRAVYRISPVADSGCDLLHDHDLAVCAKGQDRHVDSRWVGVRVPGPGEVSLPVCGPMHSPQRLLEGEAQGRTRYDYSSRVRLLCAWVCCLIATNSPVFGHGLVCHSRPTDPVLMPCVHNPAKGACPRQDVTSTVSAHTLRTETCMAGMGCIKEYREVSLYAYGHTSSTPPGIVQSDEYVAWPPHVAGAECVAVLETNWLTPAQCPLPAHCGVAVFHKTSISWLGEELGLCVGAGVDSLKILEHGSPAHHNGTARAGFVRIGRLDTNSTSDFCNLAGITVTVTFPNGTSWLVSRAALYNVPVFNKRTGTAIVKHPKMESRAGRAHCPVHPGNVNLNPITRRLPIISLSAGESWPTLPPMPLYLEEGIMVHGSNLRNRPCPCQTVGLAETTNSILPCIPHHHVTKYALPGSSYAKDAILWIWDILAAKLAWVLANFLDLMWDAFCTVNTHIRLSEALIVLALSGWYFDQPHRALVVTCAYAVTVGVTRN